MRRKLSPDRTRAFLLPALLVTLVTVVLFAASCAKTERPEPTDSDKALLGKFAEHEAEFNRLVELARQDAHMARITYDLLQTETATAWPRPEAEWGITRERWQAYNDLFTELNLSNGLIQYYPTTVWLIVSGKGMEAGGSGKGYAFLTEPPKKTYDSLDNFVFKDIAVTGHFAYRPIKGNWYLFVASY